MIDSNFRIVAENKKVLLHLSLIPNIGPARIIAILRTLAGDDDELFFGGGVGFDLEQLYTYTPRDFVARFHCSQAVATELYDGLQDRALVRDELALIARYNVTVLTIFDSAYPRLLRTIYLPPIVLYCIGALLVDERPAIAIVGSRKAGTYAQSVIDALVPGLVNAGWSIVSGGALGVDAMAHQAALDAQGSTIVVLGSGLLVPYPSSNKSLFRAVIQQGGTLISPFALNTTALKGNFPARNRIISGLSRGCVLVQAAAKSGARITAQFALDQGRAVFAVPGSIFDELSAGCHELIAQGAHLVNNVDDILCEFGQASHDNGDKINNATDQNTTLFEPAVHIACPIQSALSHPMSLESLSMEINIDQIALQDKLFMLQLEGKVRQNFAGCWERC